jgi:hypothetical protein
MKNREGRTTTTTKRRRSTTYARPPQARFPLRRTARRVYVHRNRSTHHAYGRTASPKLPIREALVILREIAKRPISIESLIQKAAVSRATVYRVLADCERELGMQIACDDGIYSVRDWGLFNRRRFLE